MPIKKAPKVDGYMSDSFGLLNSVGLSVMLKLISLVMQAPAMSVVKVRSSVHDGISIDCSISNTDLTDNNFPDISPVTDMETTETGAVAGTQDTSCREGQ